MADQPNMPRILHAFKVIRAHTPQMVTAAHLLREAGDDLMKDLLDDTRTPFWDVSVGTMGWVGEPRADKGGYAAVALIRLGDRGFEERPGVGYIPRSFIEVGKERKFRMEIQGAVPTFKPYDIKPGKESKFSNFLKSIVRVWDRERSSMIPLGFSEGYLKWAVSKDCLHDAILDGMTTAKSLSLFTNGCPTWGALKAKLPHLVARPGGSKPSLDLTRPGIYALLYRKKLPNGSYYYWWYVGNSVDMEERLRQHEIIIKSTNRIPYSYLHYSVARDVWLSEAGEYCCVALAQWNPSQLQDNSNSLLYSAEQFFQCALHSFSRQLLEKPGTIGDFVRRGQDFSIGTLLSQLTQEVAKKTGWKMELDIEGLNFSMAMAEASRSERVSFTKLDILDSSGKTKMETFTRLSKIVEQKQGKGTRFRLNILPREISHTLNKGKPISKTIREGFNITGVTSWNIPGGTTISVIIEVMPQGSLHHTPWLRIPTQYGPFSNVHDLKRIGIRLEWCVDGEYKTAYTQSSGISNLSASPIYKNHTDHHHLPQQYIKMMNLFSALYNVDWQPNSPSWMAPICRLHIQEIKYNHMEQRLDVITPQRLRASAPVPLTSQHNHKKMLMDFGPRLVIGQKPDNVFAGITHAATYATHGDNPPIDHRNRQKCNYCNFEKIDQDIRKSGREIDGGCKPTLRNGEYSCAECAKLSLPCTWSLASDIRAYGWIGLSPDCVRNIAPQVIQTPFVTSTNTDVGLLRDDAASDSGEEQDFD